MNKTFRLFRLFRWDDHKLQLIQYNVPLLMVVILVRVRVIVGYNWVAVLLYTAWGKKKGLITDSLALGLSKSRYFAYWDPKYDWLPRNVAFCSCLFDYEVWMSKLKTKSFFSMLFSNLSYAVVAQAQCYILLRLSLARWAEQITFMDGWATAGFLTCPGCSTVKWALSFYSLDLKIMVNHTCQHALKTCWPCAHNRRVCSRVHVLERSCGVNGGGV